MFQRDRLWRGAYNFYPYRQLCEKSLENGEVNLYFTFTLFCLIPIFGLTAQDWNYQMGINSTSFRYQSPAGTAENSFQPDAGLHLSLQRTNRLIDSVKTSSKFLRKLT